MNTSEINWGDDIIDSRDIISRYEELLIEEEYLEGVVEEAKEKVSEFLKEHGGEENLTEDQRECLDDLDKELEEAEGNLIEFNSSFEKDELETLKEVITQGESSPDWSYGEQLIHEDYFTEYTEELVNDCWEMPKEFNEGKWPWNHMFMDWESAAEELKQDYFTIGVQGETYYIRA